MEMTTRGLWTLIHGMGFGGIYLLACPVAIIEVFRRYKPYALQPIEIADETFLGRWFVAMAVLAWITVLTGAYMIYPWYRAVPPPGTAVLDAFPQAMLKSSSDTIGWHSIGMEWKEHIAWIVPISITMAASVFLHYRRSLRNYPQLRLAVLIFVFVSFGCAGIAGFFGAELSEHAPVDHGSTIRILQGK
ncbi:MAG TPA: hypothetical protein VGI45_15010 [Terracidiphilus sp.]|jgi:uncharacterized membrane protein